MTNETKSETEEHDMNRDEDTPAYIICNIMFFLPNNISLIGVYMHA